MVRTTCCFTRVEDCALIVAGINFLKSLMFFGLICYLLGHYKDYAEELRKGESRDGGNNDAVTKRLLVMLSMNLIVYCAEFLTTIVLICGLLKRNQDLIFPWLVVWLIYMTYFVTDVVLLLTTSVKPTRELNYLYTIIGIIASIGFNIFAFCTIVRAYLAIRYQNYLMGASDT